MGSTASGSLSMLLSFVNVRYGQLQAISGVCFANRCPHRLQRHSFYANACHRAAAARQRQCLVSALYARNVMRARVPAIVSAVTYATWICVSSDRLHS